MLQNDEIQNSQGNNNQLDNNQNREINVQNRAIQAEGIGRNSQNIYFNSYEILMTKEICFLLFCIGVEEIAILEFIQISGVSFLIPLGLLGSYPLYKFLKSIFDLKKNECQQQSILIVDSFLECVSVLLICLFFKYNSIYFSFICMPLFFSLLLKLDTLKIQGYADQKDFIYFCKILGFIFYAGIWVQLLQFSLKIDFLIQMNCQVLLWPFWLIFALISLFTIFFLYQTLKFSAICLKTPSHKKELLGFFVTFLVLSLFTTSLLLTSLKVLNYLQDTSKLYKDSYSLVFCFAATPLISVLTLTFKNLITQTVKFILQYEEDSLDNQDHQPQGEQQIQRELPRLEIYEQQKYIDGVIKLNINQKNNPLYLQKQSATFFSKSINLNKHTNQSNSKQKELLNEFKQSIKRSVSVDIQQEEPRKIQSAARYLHEPTVSTLETDIKDSKTTINQMPFKFPVEFNGFKNENFKEKTEYNKLQQNQQIELQQNKDMHDIFNENDINRIHRKSQSSALRKEDMKPEIKDYSQKQDEESKNTSVQNCLVCFENQPDTVFMNCGHGGICYECALLIWKNTQECYLCRQKVEQLYQLEYNSDNKDNVMKVLSKTIQANQLY